MVDAMAVKTIRWDNHNRVIMLDQRLLPNKEIYRSFRDYEGVREPNMITGRGDHTGLVLDGLVFDASGRNAYFDKPPGASSSGSRSMTRARRTVSPRTITSIPAGGISSTT